MPHTADNLNELYGDAKACAKLIGLACINSDGEGYTRHKHGTGYTYRDIQDQTLVDKTTRAWITELAIPPAWQQVWISPDNTGHVLATGIDERGRKQYIYHPKWRTMRDLVKFYRMLVFGAVLPKIRQHISKHLQSRQLSHDTVMAIMLWLLDSTYIRIGNDVYFQENESIGLTTLTDKNIMIAGSVVTLSFTGKSGQQQQITFDNAFIANKLNALQQLPGARLFQYQSHDDWHEITASDINSYLRDITTQTITAKDFRTWGGTLIAFYSLIQENAKPKSAKPEKAVIAAVDQAAAILGNTRTVARSSYVHPHLLSVYGHKDFDKYYSAASKHHAVSGLDERESELLHFLKALFESEFDLLKHKA